MLYEITQCEIQVGLFTDHSMVTLSIENIESAGRGWDFGKINMALLKEN